MPHATKNSGSGGLKQSVDTPFDPHKHLCLPDLKYRTASFLCYMEDVCFTLTLNHYYRLKDVIFLLLGCVIIKINRAELYYT